MKNLFLTYFQKPKLNLLSLRGKTIVLLKLQRNEKHGVFFYFFLKNL